MLQLVHSTIAVSEEVVQRVGSMTVGSEKVVQRAGSMTAGLEEEDLLPGMSRRQRHQYGTVAEECLSWCLGSASYIMRTRWHKRDLVLKGHGARR